jgi:hypothetical protein
MDLPHKDITQAGELVRVTGIGIGRPVRFIEYVENIEHPDRSYVTIRDTVTKGATGGTHSVRAHQVTRIRGQRT